MDICDRFISQCCWMNVHIVPTHREVFEIRVAQGYGARWSRDGTKVHVLDIILCLISELDFFIQCVLFAVHWIS